MQRRHLLKSILSTAAATLAASSLSRGATDHLPLKKSFVGREKFDAVVEKALSKQWNLLPVGERMAQLAMEFHNVPYVSWSLEIDDTVECPSANLRGLDCWTFFEIVQGLARMLERPQKAYSPTHLLQEIEWTRYRGGRCHGAYLDRIHYLNEWFIDNEARGNIEDLTRSFGGHTALKGRQSREMSDLWQHYRYLKKNPALRPKMAALEASITRLPVAYIPNEKVPAMQQKLKNGDIVGIVTKDQGTVCSHVGLIIWMQGEKRPRIMHASSNHKKVVIDAPLSEYLQTYTKHMGIIPVRALPVSSAIVDSATYRKNLSKLGGGVIVG